jgi:hypothetical protein
VKVQYKCDGVGVPLWPSVKQGVGSTGTSHRGPAAPPADIAWAWHETPAGPKPTCGGEAHTYRYVVSRATEATETQWNSLVAPDHASANVR